MGHSSTAASSCTLKTCTRAPLLVEATVEDQRIVRTVATNLGEWDYTAQVTLGGIIHEQLAEVKSGRLSLDMSSAVQRTPATVTPDTVVADTSRLRSRRRAATRLAGRTRNAVKRPPTLGSWRHLL